MPNFDLTGRVAIVTGGSEGIGEGIAFGLAGAGVDVVLASRNREKLEAVAGRIRALGRRALAVPTDVTRSADAQRLIDAARAEFGRIDVLVNNAGGSFGASFSRGPLLSLDESDFDGCYGLNVKSLFVCSKAAVAVMMEQGAGSIINISSIAGGGQEAPNPGFALYGSREGLGLGSSGPCARPALTSRVIGGVGVGAGFKPAPIHSVGPQGTARGAASRCRGREGRRICAICGLIPVRRRHDCANVAPNSP